MAVVTITTKTVSAIITDLGASARKPSAGIFNFSVASASDFLPGRGVRGHLGAGPRFSPCTSITQPARIKMDQEARRGGVNRVGLNGNECFI